MSSKISEDRARFEKWHSEFYGPQDKYNPIRSLELHGEGTGLGYVDPTVQAQFCAFQGAATVVERQEPVAWRFRVSDLSDWFTTTRKDVAEMFRKSPDGGHSEPLYASPPAPVSVVLPERRVQPNGFTGKGWAELRGWNACLDKVKELNQ